MTQRRGFDIVLLAKRINLRLREHNRLHPARRVLVTPAMSRILENDPDYLPLRSRKPGRAIRRPLNPTIRTITEIATALDTSVGDLLGEPLRLAPADRVRLVAAQHTIKAILDLEN